MVIEIPKQLQNPEFRFCLLKPKSKIPFEKDWHKNGYAFDNPKLLTYISNGGNYGVIGGYGNLRIIDKDKVELPIELETFTIKTGSGGRHFYIITDYKNNHVFVNGMGEVRANNYQVVGAGCIHPNGNQYIIEKDLPILTISREDFQELIKDYIKTNDGDRPLDETLEKYTNKEIKGEDTSRSGLEYRKVLALLRKGKTRVEIYEEMKAYSKWSIAPEQYRSTTFEKAESFFLEEQEQIKLQKNVINEPTQECLDILKNPKLFEMIIKELDKKIEGEEKSKKAITLSLCSVWNKNSEVPLNTLVSSESSAGKSYICKSIIKLFPKEIIEYRTKITPEAFTYWKNGEEWNWDGKICYLEDISQGILDAPTFKVMCSEGSIATIVIKQKAVDIEVKGKPVMLITTARTNPNTEILNRFQIIGLDESSKQTRAIVFRQARQKNGMAYNESVVNSLRFLKRKNVYIPYAENIATFLDKNYNFNAIRLRRDFSRLLDLIKCSAVLHQYQRKELDSETIEATEQDYFIASDVINFIQTATFKGLTHKLTKAFDCCKELREFTSKEIHAHFPFVNQKMWYNYLDDLCERGMLTAELRKTEESKKQVTFYKINEDGGFSLPNYTELLQNITIDTLDTNDTNDTIVTNDNEKRENNCKNCKNYNDFPHIIIKNDVKDEILLKEILEDFDK
ncbi:MAG: hypothetical protein EHM25_06855 [Nitrosopumilales archaeon]|nr:MAG: hypothetical protein EHM25_06855 [Nitrosopumilales archaeon]RQW76811.1 MAG: hypothetical protein EHM14_15775 [Methanothrix sp.]